MSFLSWPVFGGVEGTPKGHLAFFGDPTVK